MPRPCRDRHPTPRRGVCPTCNLYLTDQRYRELWDGDQPEPLPPPVTFPSWQNRLLPCQFLGEATGEARECPTCTGTRLIPLRLCQLHGQCTETTLLPDAQCCRLCPDRSPVKTPPPPSEPSSAIHAGLPASELAKLLPGNRDGWPEDWVHWFTTQQAYRQTFQQLIRDTPPPYIGGSGRGVVTCAGGWRFLAGVYVMARLLRALGSTLPIEVWHCGGHEYDPCFERVTAGLDVTWVDARKYAEEHGIPVRIWKGWELKSFAVMYSRFEEVIFMDADCYPERDPEYLFDHPRYTEGTALFWPDLSSNAAGAPLQPGQWHRWGLPHRNEPDFESGQMVIHRKKAWHALAVTRWMNDHSEYVYGPGNKNLYGDKSTWHIAWRGTNTPYHCCPPTRWDRVAFRQHDPDGRCIFVHRCRDKPRLDWEPWGYCTQQHSGKMIRVRHLPHEDFVHQAVADCNAMLKPVRCKSWRPGTSDDGMWREVTLLDLYQLPPRFEAGTSVIDVGAHIGFFTLACHQRGAQIIHSYDPLAINWDHLKANVGDLTGVSLFPYAVGDQHGTISMEFDPKDPACSKVSAIGTQTAELVPFSEVVRRMQICSPTGRISLVKLDCEGCEWPALASTDLSAIDRIVGEYHLTNAPNGMGIEWLRQTLEAAGFKVSIRETHTTHGLFFAER